MTSTESSAGLASAHKKWDEMTFSQPWVLLSGAQLADDLLGSVELAFHGAFPGQFWPVPQWYFIF